MVAEAHWVAAFGDAGDELVEEGVGTAVCGEYGESAAPGGDGFGDAVEETLVLVESEFVEDDMTGLAGQGVGIGGESLDPAAVSKFQCESGRVVVWAENDFAQIDSAEVQDFCPALAVFQGEAGLEVVTRGDEGVEAGAGCADEANGAVIGGVGGADLAGFFHDF